MEEGKVTPLKQWEFDHWSCQHWDEQRQGNVDQTKSWIELSDVDVGLWGQKLTVYTNRKPGLEIIADRDQWGTWITFSIDGKGVTIAQEDGTMSFVDALIAALTEFKKITDIETKPPIVTDLAPANE